MYKRIIILTFLIVSISLSSCTKKESPASPQPSTSQQSVMPDHADIQMPPAGEMKVIIPEDIKARWKGVVLTVMDRETMNAKNYTVPLGGRLIIPDSKIEVQTAEFLPDLKIDGKIYTTASSELLNPAIHVLITEAGKEIFKGWLFQKFPSVHPFKHQRFGITFKEPVDTL